MRGALQRSFQVISGDAETVSFKFWWVYEETHESREEEGKNNNKQRLFVNYHPINDTRIINLEGLEEILRGLKTSASPNLQEIHKRLNLAEALRVGRAMLACFFPTGMT